MQYHCYTTKKDFSYNHCSKSNFFFFSILDWFQPLFILFIYQVAEEREEELRQTVGYCVRFDNCSPDPHGSILYCTTGILLRRLQTDPELNNITHVIIDEVHERDLNTDFLLIIVKDLIQRKSKIKFILMSATINARVFSTYFNDCPIIEVSFLFLNYLFFQN